MNSDRDQTTRTAGPDLGAVAVRADPADAAAGADAVDAARQPGAQGLPALAGERVLAARPIRSTPWATCRTWPSACRAPSSIWPASTSTTRARSASPSAAARSRSSTPARSRSSSARSATSSRTARRRSTLVLRPQTPLTFTIGAGDMTDPLIHIGISDMRIDFYAWIEERYVRLLTIARRPQRRPQPDGHQGRQRQAGDPADAGAASTRRTSPSASATPTCCRRRRTTLAAGLPVAHQHRHRRARRRASSRSRCRRWPASASTT